MTSIDDILNLADKHPELLIDEDVQTLAAEVRHLRAERDHWKQVAAERQEPLDWWAATSAKPEVTP